MSAATIPRVLILLLLTLHLGCNDGAASLSLCGSQPCPKRCVELQRGGDCDTLTERCQERIFAAVACVRGADGEMPEIRVLTEDEERAERERETLDAGVADADADAADEAAVEADATTDAGLPYRARWELALSMLGLYTDMTTFDDVDNLGGYYSGSDDRITLIDRGQPQDSGYAQTLLAHEFVHSYQDQQFGLFELRRNTGSTTDARLAVNCLVEGDATFYEELAWSLLQNLPADLAYFRDQFGARLKRARDKVAAAESPYDNLWLLHYGLGAQVVSDLWFEGGNQALQALFERPPIATVYWMRKASGDTRDENLSRRLRCDYASPPAEFEYTGGDTLGAYAFYAFLSRTLRKGGVYPNTQSWERALDWQQDRLDLFAGPADQTAASWRVRLASKELAEEIARELERSGAGQRVVQRGDELELMVADDESVLAEWHQSLPDNCTPLAQ